MEKAISIAWSLHAAVFLYSTMRVSHNNILSYYELATIYTNCMHIALEDIRLIVAKSLLVCLACMWLEEERRKTRREVRMWGVGIAAVVAIGEGGDWSQLRRQKRRWHLSIYSTIKLTL